MGFLAFLLLGLIAGAIAKALVPGDSSGGWFSTLILGVVGALVGGWLGSIIFNVNLGNFFSIQTWALAVGGAVLLLLVGGLFSGKNR